MTVEDVEKEVRRLLRNGIPMDYPKGNKMIRYFCDQCKEEIDFRSWLPVDEDGNWIVWDGYLKVSVKAEYKTSRDEEKDVLVCRPCVLKGLKRILVKEGVIDE